MQPHVSMLGSESEECEKNAIQILGSLSNNDDNGKTIIRDDGIRSLVEVMRTGSDTCREVAVAPVAHLAFNNAIKTA